MSVIRVLVCLFLLAGCGGIPHDVIGVDGTKISAADTEGAKRQRIFIATTRAPDDNPALFYSGERGPLSFAQIDVFVPPEHQVGEVERPKTLPPNPKKHFVALNPKRMNSGEEFRRAIDAALAAQPPNRRNLLVFVHGFNTSFDGSVIHLAQFVHDVEYPGVVVLFTWPSRGNAFNYVFDLNSALYSRDALMETFRLLSQTRAKHGDIMAHSMGNMLTVETLRQMELIEPSTTRNVDRRVRSIVFAAPDIDVDLFVQQIGVLPTHQYDFYMLIARDDQALSLSEFIAGGVQRAGAAELDRLRDLGIEIVDLTNVNDGSKAHSRFSRSSVIIQAVRDGTNADGSFNRSIPAPEGVTVLEAAGRVPGRLLRTVTGQPPAQ